MARLQIVEAQLDANSPVIGKVLRDLESPEGSAVAVVVRDEHAIVVRADTTLRRWRQAAGRPTSAEHEAELRSLLIGE